MHWSDPVLLALLAGLVAVEAVVLLGFIVLVQPAPPRPANADTPPGPPDGPPPSFRRTRVTGPIRSDGFVPRFGLPLAGAICFAVLLALTVVAALPYGTIPAVAGWWVAALALFGLTVRHTFQANIALALVNVAFMVAVGVVDM